MLYAGLVDSVSCVCCVCLVTMLCAGVVDSVSCIVVSVWQPYILRAGLVDSVSCIVVSVWRPCFVRVLSTVCRVMLCLSGDHASCGSCRQCVMYWCFCLATMLRAGLVDSVSCNVVFVWRPCFVRVLSTLYHVLLCLSGDHASCWYCR